MCVFAVPCRTRGVAFLEPLQESNCVKRTSETVNLLTAFKRETNCKKTPAWLLHIASTPGRVFYVYLLSDTKPNICRKDILKSKYSDIYRRTMTAFR